MKVWIVGKTGMLSKAFQRLFRSKSISYVATAKEEVDVRDAKSVRAFCDSPGVTHVINCSGFTAVELAESAYEKAYALNCQGVKNLAIAATETNKKLIHFSTDYVFDGASKVPYNEDALPNPLSVYGKTKWEGEKTLFRHQPEALLIRSSWLFGKEGNHFVKTMLELMQKRDSIDIVDDQKGRPTFCDDLVEATLELIDEKGLFHFAGKSCLSWFGWAEEILKHLKEKNIPFLCRELKPILSSSYLCAAKRPLFSVLATEKYETVTGKKPPCWEEGLRACLKEVYVKRFC